MELGQGNAISLSLAFDTAWAQQSHSCLCTLLPPPGQEDPKHTPSSQDSENPVSSTTEMPVSKRVCFEELKQWQAALGLTLLLASQSSSHQLLKGRACGLEAKEKMSRPAAFYQMRGTQCCFAKNKAALLPHSWWSFRTTQQVEPGKEYDYDGIYPLVHKLNWQDFMVEENSLFTMCQVLYILYVIYSDLVLTSALSSPFYRSKNLGLE